MPPKRGAWGDDGGDHTTVDQVEEFDPAKPSSPSAPPPPSSSQQPSTATSGEIVEGEPVDDGKPGCCARGCVGCGRVFQLIGKAILYFFLYLFGFVFLLVLGTLHAVFRILHMIFNICSQCRRADVDVMREFHYASGSDASGSEGDREADDLAAIDAFERNEQLLIIMGRGGSANNGAGSSQRPQVMSRPPRTRDDIKAARAARKAKKADDAKRIVALLSGLPDPGVQHGSKSEIYPPKFASVKCCLSSCVATFGMVLVSITFLFYSLSYSTLLGIVALASVMFPSTTVGGMKVIKEYQDHSDIMVRPPRTSEPPPAGAQAV